MLDASPVRVGPSLVFRSSAGSWLRTTSEHCPSPAESSHLPVLPIQHWGCWCRLLTLAMKLCRNNSSWKGSVRRRSARESGHQPGQGWPDLPAHPHLPQPTGTPFKLLPQRSPASPEPGFCPGRGWGWYFGAFSQLLEQDRAHPLLHLALPRSEHHFYPVAAKMLSGGAPGQLCSAKGREKRERPPAHQHHRGSSSASGHPRGWGGHPGGGRTTSYSRGASACPSLLAAGGCVLDGSPRTQLCFPQRGAGSLWLLSRSCCLREGA